MIKRQCTVHLGAVHVLFYQINGHILYAKTHCLDLDLNDKRPDNGFIFEKKRKILERTQNPVGVLGGLH